VYSSIPGNGQFGLQNMLRTQESCFVSRASVPTGAVAFAPYKRAAFFYGVL
jgi:hypothetical protein